jgi:CHAD domain-containing protein
VARAREIPGLDGDGPFGLAAARAIEVRAQEVFEHSEGVLDTDDIEPLHDMRVATRRLRAGVKALADALGERRDRDVAIEFLEGFAAEAPEGDREALGALIDGLREEQRAANEALASFLAPKRLEKLRRRLRKLVKAAAA